MQTHLYSSSAQNKKAQKTKYGPEDHNLMTLEENFFEEVDRDQLDKTIQ